MPNDKPTREEFQTLQNKITELKKQVQVFSAKTDDKDSLLIPLTSNERRAINDTVAFPICVRLKSTDAATAANYGTFFTAERSYKILAMTEVHGVAGTDGSAVTLQLEKLSGVVAPDSGTALLSTALSLKTTADTVQYGTFSNTIDARLKRGDRLCLKDAGTLTSVANVQVTVYLIQL